MTLNKASLFQLLTLNSQLSITVSAHVCTNVLVMHNVCMCHCIYICIHMTCVRMYVSYVHNIRMKLQFPLTTQ